MVWRHYHSAIDGEGAVVQLADAVADGDVDALLAPLDSGQWITPHLAVQDGVSTQRLDAIGVDVAVYDGRL